MRATARTLASPMDPVGDAGDACSVLRRRDAEPSRRTGLVRYGLLLAATMASLGVQGVLAPGPFQQVVVTALAGATLVLAFRAAALAPRWIAFATALTVGALVLSVVRAADGGVGEAAVRAMNAVLIALGPPAIAVGIVHDLRSSGRVRLEAVLGVLSLYMLLGMAYGFVYGAIDRLGGDPFFAGGDPATVSHCLYFSFTTLATVGYGDLVARTDLGHTVAVSEALIGQIYLVTVVSLIVSNLGRPARRELGSTERDLPER
jgi:Ion channel